MTLIGLVQQHARPVLLVMDGPDFIRDRTKAKELLFVDSQDDRGPRLSPRRERPVCATAQPGAAAVSPQFTQVTLVNLPVLQQDDPRKKGSGIQFFRGLFQKRAASLPARAAALLPEPILTICPITYGRARGFMQMVRRVAEEGYIVDTLMTKEILDRVLREQRLRQETGLHTGHLRVLQAIADDPNHRLPDDPLVDELVDTFSLLLYPNESEWYYPNPLLTMNLVRPSAGSMKSR
ncbi:MAG: hypothetical protein R3F14_46035 [Polyangiaceae bacterium]